MMMMVMMMMMMLMMTMEELVRTQAKYDQHPGCAKKK